MDISSRLLNPRDYGDFFDLVNNNRTHIAKYFPKTIQKVQSATDAKVLLSIHDKENIQKERYVFGIYSEAQLIGYISIKNIDWNILKCELAYFIDKNYQSQGIVSSEIKNILAFCFTQLKLEKVFLRIGTDNL